MGILQPNGYDHAQIFCLNLILVPAEAVKPSQSEMHCADLKMPKKEQILCCIESKCFKVSQWSLWLQNRVLRLI